jgi:hypothetical protein
LGISNSKKIQILFFRFFKVKFFCQQCFIILNFIIITFLNYFFSTLSWYTSYITSLFIHSVYLYKKFNPRTIFQMLAYPVCSASRGSTQWAQNTTSEPSFKCWHILSVLQEEDIPTVSKIQPQNHLYTDISCLFW